ncbi:hypothetical protein GSI_11294 [Ganoderma sinense ZZ0214-1]|uniref:Uncharacterized protein n=1 Tax=Ganoderma sinense ZZ0214-1 TaxID=1077348 RepID=A0A2G8RZ84_9APHY|nr:hypothetical protein GSI_11294 [Ganoderma sinense ZZ0214-1]
MSVKWGSTGSLTHLNLLYSGSMEILENSSKYLEVGRTQPVPCPISLASHRREHHHALAPDIDTPSGLVHGQPLFDAPSEYFGTFTNAAVLAPRRGHRLTASDRPRTAHGPGWPHVSYIHLNWSMHDSATDLTTAACPPATFVPFTRRRLELRTLVPTCVDAGALVPADVVPRWWKRSRLQHLRPHRARGVVGAGSARRQATCVPVPAVPRAAHVAS